MEGVDRRDKKEDRAKAELGKYLFFDARLSVDRSVSCATCHDPRKGWGDGRPVAVGVHGLKGKRNTPTLLNVSILERFFWDGRAETLEQQVISPIVTREEMGFTREGAERAIAAVPDYKPLFKAAFGTEDVTIQRIAVALASFEKTILTADSPYDRYEKGELTALSTEAVHGLKLVAVSASCKACHYGDFFSDSHFHNIGIGVQKTPPDEGRFEVTHRERDHGSYRTPTLRNLRYTAPYMHDGSMKTLREVVDF